MSNLAKVSGICEAGKSVSYMTCANTHFDAGTLAVSWAKQCERGSTAWDSSLDRALNEYSAAEKFVSGQQQVSQFVELKEYKSAVYKERAIREADTPGLEPSEHFRLAEAELSAGIKALAGLGRDSDEVRKERAQLYRYLATYSKAPNDRNKYLELAAMDEKTTKTSHKSVELPRKDIH